MGYALFYIVVPLFFLAGMWVVFDRVITIPPEQSINFRRYRAVVVIGLMEILFLFSWFMIRGLRALKQGDFPKHVDSVFSAFMMGSTVGVIRFMYALFWMIRGGAPFSSAGMFFITMAVVAGHLALAFALSGRLRQNKIPLLVLILLPTLLAILGANHYIFMDVP